VPHEPLLRCLYPIAPMLRKHCLSTSRALPFKLKSIDLVAPKHWFSRSKALQYQNKSVSLQVELIISRYCESHRSLRRRPHGAARYLLTGIAIFMLIPWAWGQSYLNLSPLSCLAHSFPTSK
jgi:hypothetical protein